ncbi:MAG: S8 family serine peptidase, partial [Gemmatimonadaceae bacterium]
GTSFAAPHVAAAAAILSRMNYSWSNVEIRRRLGAGATDLGAVGRDT